MININIYVMLTNMLNLMHVNIQCYKDDHSLLQREKVKQRKHPRAFVPRVPILYH